MVESDGYLHYTQGWTRPHPVVPRKPLLRKPNESAPSIPSIVKIAQELRFSEGEFWQTELGQAVLYFSLAKSEELTYPISASKTSSILAFQNEGAASQIILWATCRGILKNVERTPKGEYRLKPQHVILLGLLSLHITHGYPIREAAQSTVQLVEGTELAEYTTPEFSPGGYMTKGILDTFSKDSPWRKFPLDDFVNLGGQNEVVLGQAADLVSKES